jgi:hypothetical protein
MPDKCYLEVAEEMLKQMQNNGREREESKENDESMRSTRDPDWEL